MFQTKKISFLTVNSKQISKCRSKIMGHSLLLVITNMENSNHMSLDQELPQVLQTSKSFIKQHNNQCFYWGPKQDSRNIEVSNICTDF